MSPVMEPRGGIQPSRVELSSTASDMYPPSPGRSCYPQNRWRRYAEASSVLIDAVELYEKLRRGDPTFPRNTETDQPLVDIMSALVMAFLACKRDADVLLHTFGLHFICPERLFLQGRSSTLD